MRYKKIKSQLYFCDLILVQCDDPEKIRKKFFTECDVFREDLSFDIYPSFVLETKSDFLIAYRDKKDIDAGIIAHESLHVAHKIFDSIGALANFENDEPLAYLTGWVANEFSKFVKN